MAPFEWLTENSAWHFVEIVAGLGYLAFALWQLSLSLDGHPDPILFGMNQYLILGIGWLVAGFLTWAGIRITRKQRMAERQ